MAHMARQKRPTKRKQSKRVPTPKAKSDRTRMAGKARGQMSHERRMT